MESYFGNISDVAEFISTQVESLDTILKSKPENAHEAFTRYSNAKDCVRFISRVIAALNESINQFDYVYEELVKE